MDQGSTYGGLIIAPGHVHDIIMEPGSRECRGSGMQAIGLFDQLAHRTGDASMRSISPAVMILAPKTRG
jgi:hypothetical protein